MSGVITDSYLSDLLKDWQKPSGNTHPWLNQLRTEALDCVSTLRMPLTSDEDWRFTNIASLTALPFHEALSTPKLIPSDIEVSVTRNYGETAAEKSNELLLHMAIAVFGVAILILVFLGWRESLVVMLAIPSTLALTLLVFYLYGYTLNRITLFALIFSIGILVDDAIVVVENIVRHMRMPQNSDRSLVKIAVEAVGEVGNPTILATWAVIAAILPMAFVGGLMGPYMRPIPIGASAAMLFSHAVTILPTLACDAVTTLLTLSCNAMTTLLILT